MRPARYDAPLREESRDGVLCHVVPCTCPTCTEELVVTLSNGRRKPPSVIANIARRRGWEVRPKKRTYLCRKHAK